MFAVCVCVCARDCGHGQGANPFIEMAGFSKLEETKPQFVVNCLRFRVLFVLVALMM